MEGMLSALLVAEKEWVAFCSCDMPLIPEDYIQQLWQQKKRAPAVWARSSEHDHPAPALVNRQLAEPLAAYLAQGERRLMQFLREQGGHAITLTQDEAAFRNMNTLDDLQEAR
ncbi:NTP transferase domain-containing protein [Candidatus Pantoea persica]|uniref:NTP transferase domain-containing protein n=1 Tax=Candidatus Pantoea persica TaxID=2518128 RepID=UPI00215D624E|nr:NTP transferase domain-containing protein [Candidatus Pantoea persica]